MKPTTTTVLQTMASATRNLMVAVLFVNVAVAAPQLADDINPGRQVAVVTQDDGRPYRRCVLTLAKADGAEDVDLYLFLRGDTVVRAYPVWRNGQAGRPRRVDVSGLSVEGAALRGQLKFALVRGDIGERQFELTLNVTWEGTRVTGTYGLAGALTAKGSATGEILGERELRLRYALAPGCDWPKWFGPAEAHVATPTKAVLVDDLRKAKLVWVSETMTPPGRGQAPRYGGRGGFYDQGSGGGCSPIVRDGKVYLYFYQPAGEEYDTEIEKMALDAKAKKTKGGFDEFYKEYWKIRANDVVVCLDAATGKTLWKTVFPLNGYYTAASKDLMAGNSPVVYDGRVIGATGDHLIYCLDAATGKELWRTPGPRHPERMKLLAQSLAEKKSAGYGGNRNMMNNPTYADGVFIMPSDCIADANGELIVRTPDRKRVRGSGIWGFDAATGKVLWRRNERIMGGMFTPVVWANQGRQFVIIGNGFHDDGVPTLLRCLDPKTGKDLWTLPTGSNGFAPALFDDVLVLNVGDDKSATGQVGALRLTPTGPKKLWELPAAYGYVTARNGVARIGDRIVLVLAERTVVVELATGKVVSEAADKKFTGSLLMSFNDRILCQPDTAHNATLLRMFGLRDGQLTVLGGDWDPPHLPSGSYEVPWIHPLLDGRVIIRGGESIYCYDLRAASKPTGEDGRAASKP